MNPSYYMKQVARESNRMLSEMHNERSDESDSDPDTVEQVPEVPSGSGENKEFVTESDHPITYPFPAVTMEKVLLEVQVVLGQVRKLSGEVKAMEKSQGIAIKKLKRDVELIKDTLIKTDRPKIVWPVKTQEEFDSLNDEIETNSIFADQMVFIIITN